MYSLIMFTFARIARIARIARTGFADYRRSANRQAMTSARYIILSIFGESEREAVAREIGSLEVNFPIGGNCISLAHHFLSGPLILSSALPARELISTVDDTAGARTKGTS